MNVKGYLEALESTFMYVISDYGNVYLIVNLLDLN